MALSGSTAIVGVGVADTGGPVVRNTYHLGAQAAKRALEDAGLSAVDVDGILTYNALNGPHLMHSTVMAEHLGLRVAFNAHIGLGGATPAVLVEHAAAAIHAGLCETVLIVHADNRVSGGSRGQSISRMAREIGDPQWEYPYGPMIVSMYAMMAQRHMHDYGLTSEQMAHVAVTFRRHAALNPRATKRDPLTVADVLNSALICSPFRMLDCCLVTDFGGALVITSREKAARLKKLPVHLLGVGEYSTHEQVSQAPPSPMSGMGEAGRRAFAMAGVGPDDIDVAGLYDSFTFTVIAQLEELGFCGRGEGGAFAAAGQLALGAKLPTNTHGGLLSAYTSGLFHIIEVVQQLRGECGDRQVKGAELGLVNNSGGILSAHCTLILGR